MRPLRRRGDGDVMTTSSNNTDDHAHAREADRQQRENARAMIAQAKAMREAAAREAAKNDKKR
jgi:hypothetical protein